MDNEALIKKVRDAIFLAALQNWEESCTFDELSAEGQRIYDDYARAAVAAMNADHAELRAQVLAIGEQITAAVAEKGAVEAAGCHAITALKAAKASSALSAAQRGLIEEALGMMFSAKPRWDSLP